mmetsp:Transcript_129286/g.374348  ORF Transcript_129286/g.374348 Transcript_129286/m.374348 type:complete len:232 (+) Transcript_129286:317-1012(+)
MCRTTPTPNKHSAPEPTGWRTMLVGSPFKPPSSQDALMSLSTLNGRKQASAIMTKTKHESSRVVAKEMTSTLSKVPRALHCVTSWYFSLACCSFFDSSATAACSCRHLANSSPCSSISFKMYAPARSPAEACVTVETTSDKFVNIGKIESGPPAPWRAMNAPARTQGERRKRTGDVPRSICGMLTLTMPHPTLVGQSGPPMRIATLPGSRPLRFMMDSMARVGTESTLMSC